MVLIVFKIALLPLYFNYQISHFDPYNFFIFSFKEKLELMLVSCIKDMYLCYDCNCKNQNKLFCKLCDKNVLIYPFVKVTLQFLN